MYRPSRAPVQDRDRDRQRTAALRAWRTERSADRSGSRFPNDTCDVITTFDVVKTYEERQTWKNVRQKISVVIDGTPYPAKFRDLGFYPLGLNLACIDFESPFLRAELQLPALPLNRDSAGSAPLSYDDVEIAKSDPGTPFLNDEAKSLRP